MMSDRTTRRARSSGFTLIEVMLVISIMGVVMTIGVPAMFRSFQKDPIRQASETFLAGCGHARSQAIMSGQTVDLVIDLVGGSLRTVKVAGGAVAPGPPPDFLESGMIESRPSRSSGAGYSGRLPEALEILILGVNFIELQDEPSVFVRFFPNGTSDEFTVVFRWEEKVRKVSLEVATGMADLEVYR